jgi:hypothetical protein
MKYDHQFWGLGTEHILETDVYKEQDIVDLVSKYLGQGHFGGIREATFAPSIQQIHDLYRMRHGHLDIMRVLRNFSERNQQPSVSKASFYLGQLSYEARWDALALARRAHPLTKPIKRLLRRVADRIALRRPFR